MNKQELIEMVKNAEVAAQEGINLILRYKDEDEIRVLRKALWGKSYNRPKQNRYNSTPVRFTFPDGEVKEFSTQREAAEMSGLNKWTLDRACRLQIPLKKGNFAGATVEILSQ